MLSMSRKPMQQQALRNLRRPLNLCAWTGWTGTACTEAPLGVPVVITQCTLYCSTTTHSN